MKRLFLLILSILAINSCVQGAQSSLLPKTSPEISSARHIYKLSHGPIPTQTPTDIKARDCDVVGDYFETKIRAYGYRLDIVSYFNLNDHQSLLLKTLQPDASGRLDFRPLEKLYCKKAIASTNVFFGNRGKLGFVLGVAAATFFVTGYLNSPLAVKRLSQDPAQ